MLLGEKALAIFIGTIIGIGFASIILMPIYRYFKKHGGTPYEKKLRKKWEAEQQEEQAFRAAAEASKKQNYETWKAQRQQQEQQN